MATESTAPRGASKIHNLFPRRDKGIDLGSAIRLLIDLTIHPSQDKQLLTANRECFDRESEKKEYEIGLRQKKTGQSQERERISRAPEANGRGVHESCPKREIVRPESVALTRIVRRSSQRSRVNAERTVRRDMALFSSNASFDPRLFRGPLSRSSREHARRHNCGDHLRREPA